MRSHGLPTAEAMPLRTSASGLQNSRHVSNPAYRDEDGLVYWGSRAPLRLSKSPSDAYVTITEAMSGRLDLLSYRHYGTSELWWVIAEVNDLFFPFEDLEVGTVIWVPSYTTLTTHGVVR